MEQLCIDLPVVPVNDDVLEKFRGNLNALPKLVHALLRTTTVFRNTDKQHKVCQLIWTRVNANEEAAKQPIDEDRNNEDV